MMAQHTIIKKWIFQWEQLLSNEHASHTAELYWERENFAWVKCPILEWYDNGCEKYFVNWITSIRLIWSHPRHRHPPTSQQIHHPPSGYIILLPNATKHHTHTDLNYIQQQHTNQLSCPLRCRPLHLKEN